MLIPPLALLIGAHRLSGIRPAPAPSWWGLPLVFAGFLLLAVSRLSAFEPPSYYGFVLCLAGLAAGFFGRLVLMALWPAFAYLLFAIPLPRLIEVALTAKMQIVSTTMGVAVLQALGIPVFQDGNIIDLGTEKLQVVEACSGLRYLFPLLSFGFLVAWLFDGPLWKRAVIFLSAVPLTLAMNALRIAVAGILIDRWGSGMAEGLVHDFQGWAVFALSIVFLLAVTWLLSLIGRDKGCLRFELFGLPERPLLGGKPYLRPEGAGSAALCLLLAGSLALANIDGRAEIVPERKSFDAFPLSLGEWRGEAESFDPRILSALGATDYRTAEYRRSEDEAPVNLFMAYYASQRVGVSAHSPANCIPGSGWRVISRGIVPVDTGQFSLPVTRMVIRKDNASLLVWYWFDQRGRILNEQYGAKWYLLVDSLTRQRTDGAIVRLTTPLPENGGEHEADTRLTGFIRSLYPATPDFIPG